MSAQPPVYVMAQQPQRMNPLLATFIGIALAIAAQWFGIPLPHPPAVVPPSFPPPAPPAPQPPAPPVMPPPAPPAIPPAPPAPKPNALSAIGQIQFGSAGCSATIIGPRREDGRWFVLTAAHCIPGNGATGSMKLRDGRRFGVQVVALDRKADACWMVTTTVHDDLPFTFVAKSSPAPGARIWHAGFGVDKPANREDGTVTTGPNSDGQIEMRISVSSGDSGGGMILEATGEVISCVCCTTARGAVARVWGASPEAIARLKPTAVLSEEWEPVPIPECIPASK